MEHSQLITKLHDLEKEIQLLKHELLPEAKKTARRLRAVSKFLLANWLLLSFLVAIGTAIYVRIRYDIDPLEDYRNASTTKKLADFYRKMGDDMMLKTEYLAASDYYKSALELRKNDVLAAQGLVKAEVFTPLKGQKSVPPQVIDYRLDHLIKLFPEDPQVLFLQGWMAWQRGRADDAIRLTREALESARKSKQDFAPGYVQLGFYLQQVSIEEAIDNYKKALKLDPNNLQANNNLGFCQLLTMDFPDSIVSLQRAYDTQPHLLTAISLGDAYRASGDLEHALLYHELAKGVLENGKVKDDELIEQRFISDGSVLNYMPKRKGDVETIKKWVPIGINEMKSLLYYSLSFDYAIKDDFAKADEAFSRAQNWNNQKIQNGYLLSEIEFIRNNLNPDIKSQAWFDIQTELLGSNKP